MAAIGVSGVIFDGSDAFTLARGIGHVPGSALPGQRGNVVLAGHRDTFLRDLEHVTLGESVTIETPMANANYTVTAINVVDPTETSVMRPTSDFRITLILSGHLKSGHTWTPWTRPMG
jgi:sortase A